MLNDVNKEYLSNKHVGFELTEMGDMYVDTVWYNISTKIIFGHGSVHQQVPFCSKKTGTLNRCSDVYPENMPFLIGCDPSPIIFIISWKRTCFDTYLDVGTKKGHQKKSQWRTSKINPGVFFAGQGIHRPFWFPNFPRKKHIMGRLQNGWCMMEHPV